MTRSDKKRHWFFAGLFVFMVFHAPSGAPAQPPIDGNWTMTFEDEFDGTVLDSEKWKIGQHWSGINALAQPHQDNIEVDGGVLRFTWDKKPEQFTFGALTSQYGTGEVSTFKRFHQQYGYFECRMRYDVHRGCWPAFWTMPAIDKAGPDQIRRVYLKVDLAGLAGDEVDSAYLQLWVVSAGEGYFFDLYPCHNDTWSETGITWNNKPPFDAVFIDQVKPARMSGAVRIDVTDFVNEQLRGDKVASFVVAEQYQRESAIVFYSSEAPAAGCRPLLMADGAVCPVIEDSYVNSADASANYGDDTTLAVFDRGDYSSSTYTPGMEIDIHETLGIWGPDKTQHAWHWNGYGADHQSGHSPVVETADQNEFRTFGVYWTEGKMEFYIDGRHTHTHIGAEVCAVPSFMIISGQVGGWDNNGADLETHFDPYLPLHLEVDYVKVWSGTKAGDSAYVPPETPNSLAIYSDTSTLNISVVQEKDCVVEEVASGAYEGVRAYEMTYDFTGWYTQFKLVVDNWAGHFAMSGFNVFSFAHKGAEGLDITVMLVEPGGAVTNLGAIPGSASWRVDSIFFTPVIGNFQAIQFTIGGAESATGTLLLDDIRGYKEESTAVRSTAYSIAARNRMFLSPATGCVVYIYDLNGRRVRGNRLLNGPWPANGAHGVFAVSASGKAVKIAVHLGDEHSRIYQ